MRLHCEQVKLKNGVVKFRVRYWENGKNIVLKDHPFFNSFDAAKNWCAQQNEKNEAFRVITHNNNLNEIAFKNEVVGDWNTIVGEFLDWHKINARNTHETAKSWLLNYIFPFFISKRAKFGLWPEYFEEFKEHLMVVVSPKNGRTLSYSSRNHIIKYLNLFLTFLRTKKKVIGAFDKCSYFAKSLVNSRGLESLITRNEQEYLTAVMNGNESLEFLYILLKTGLRLNELFSLQAVCVDMNLSHLNSLILKPFENKTKRLCYDT